MTSRAGWSCFLLPILFLGLSAAAVSAANQIDQESPAVRIDQSGFVEVWNSGDVLYGYATLAAGDIDGDGLIDFVGNRYHGAGSTLHLFESDRMGGFSEVWHSGNVPGNYGAFTKAAYGDSDGDGLPEILASCAGGPDIVIFEKVADTDVYEVVYEYWSKPELWIISYVAEILVGDATGDGNSEIIFAKRGSPHSQYNRREVSLTVLSHAGSTDPHNFEPVFELKSDYGILGAVLGDPDHDGAPDIVLQSARVGEVWRFEYDSEVGTWAEKVCTLDIDASLSTPKIIRTKHSGGDILVFSSNGRGVVVDSNGDDAFFVRCVSGGPPGGSLLRSFAVLAARPHRHEVTYVAEAYRSGDIAVWTLAKDLNRFELVDRFNQDSQTQPVIALAYDVSDRTPALVVAGVSQIVVYRQQPDNAAVEACAIDIRPGNETNRVNCNPRARGLIPVAILTSADFDATAVDQSTVRFGPGQAADVQSPHFGVQRHEKDVDGDGDLDLLFRFRTADTGIQCGDTEATLTGMTFDGQAITATDAIQTKHIGGTASGLAGTVAVSPNPFNPATWVAFATDQSQRVRVTVYDIRGRLVIEIANQQYEAGEHLVEWQGRDSTGQTVPSGQYFFRVEAGGEVQIEKALMLK